MDDRVTKIDPCVVPIQKYLCHIRGISIYKRIIETHFSRRRNWVISLSFLERIPRRSCYSPMDVYM